MSKPLGLTHVGLKAWVYGRYELRRDCHTLLNSTDAREMARAYEHLKQAIPDRNRLTKVLLRAKFDNLKITLILSSWDKGQLEFQFLKQIPRSVENSIKDFGKVMFR